MILKNATESLILKGFPGFQALGLEYPEKRHNIYNVAEH
jgi:hypothetical protein